MIPNDFDWIFYVNHYSDLSKNGITTEKQAREHYMQYGHKEHRPYRNVPCTTSTIVDGYTLDDVNINKDDEYPIIIVYFVYINPDKNWKDILQGQIKDLLATNILSTSKMFIVMTGEHTQKAQEMLQDLLVSFASQVYYSHSTVNCFEYEGIKKLHDLGTSFPHKTFLYFHSKGMVFSKKPGRHPIEQFITPNTLKHWKHVLHIFDTMPHINKIGLCPSTGGWIWYNFFWIRGDFLKTYKPPIITNDRYYYEEWLGDDNHGKDCYSLLTNGERTFTQKECIRLHLNHFKLS